MDTTWTIVFVLGLTALTILLTGPGLWSEKWGLVLDARPEPLQTAHPTRHLTGGAWSGGYRMKRGNHRERPGQKLTRSRATV